MYTLFIDFKKAYDSIHRPSLLNTLKEFNLPKKLINLIKATMENFEIKIKIANSTSQLFKVTTGLRQRDALSLILFNLVLGKGCQRYEHIRRYNIRTVKDRSAIAYTDDIAIIRDNIEIIKIHCKKLMDVARKVGLIINDE